MSGTVSTVLIVAVIGVVVYMLFTKAERTLTSVNRSNKSTYTPSTAISSAVTNLAPALGTFLSGLLSSDDSGGAYDRSGSASYSDDLLEPTFDEGYV